MEIERQPSKMMEVLGEAVESSVTIHHSCVLGLPIIHADRGFARGKEEATIVGHALERGDLRPIARPLAGRTR